MYLDPRAMQSEYIHTGKREAVITYVNTAGCYTGIGRTQDSRGKGGEDIAVCPWMSGSKGSLIKSETLFSSSLPSHVTLNPFVISHQPCRQWEETQRGARASFPSLSWETPTTPAPHLDAAMARCGVPLARATMTTANGASVPIKVCKVNTHLGKSLLPTLNTTSQKRWNHFVCVLKATVCSWWRPMSSVMLLVWSTPRTLEH